jgi:3-oxoacyl-[acyl-carrier protein] reductase
MNTPKNAQVAIVTGASRGIGAAVAQRLAKDGFAVAVNYASSSAEADALVAELTAAGAKAVAVKADVSNADDVRRMFETTEQQLGKVDVLVNNAGVLKTVPLADTSDALYNQTFNINVRGTFNTLREAAARMNDGGRIVNFSSTTLALNMPGYAIYNATKAAVESFTHVFAKELRAGSDRDIAVPRRQDRRTDPDLREDAAAATPRPTGRYCVGGGVPRRSGRGLDQRADSACERRYCLTRSVHIAAGRL